MKVRGFDEEGSFSDFFQKATGDDCFPFQRQFAQSCPSLVSVPTGLGKTAMVVVGWLWRRFGLDATLRSQTPRRLVYCLPMRVLVEQTAKNACQWVKNLQSISAVKADVAVHILMGGEETDDWDIHPEREAIIIGTQDMLLSCALNRGYAASRSRWPMQFGLLHTDCLWVYDEVQLMGAGLATTTQLEAFRNLLGNSDGHGCRSVWMSATMQRSWLNTVDFGPFLTAAPELAFNFDHEIKTDGLSDKARGILKDRWDARKPLQKSANSKLGDAPTGLAREIRDAHKSRTRTIVVVNTVKRACELYGELNKPEDGDNGQKRKKARDSRGVAPTTAAVGEKPKIVLLHSRFRPDDRKKVVESALADPSTEGTIIISTQVIEAGVDISATTLFTELAPWASLVQRFGRCNRKGEANEQAMVRWIDLPDKKQEDFARPYELADLELSCQRLGNLNDVGIRSLPEVELPFEHNHVVRRKDLIDLFDTTPDLAGNDIDIDRFVREIEESDVRVFWRTWAQPKGHEPPSEDEPAARREELCSAPVGEFRDFAKKHVGNVWRWSFLEKKWEKADAGKILPGQMFLVHANTGGYSNGQGWNPASTQAVVPIVPRAGMKLESPDATDTEQFSRIGVWQTISKHTDEVCDEMDLILQALPISEAEVLRTAARWHDWGKAHDVFQQALPDDAPESEQLWAKAAGNWKKYARKHFRHELASALAVLLLPDERIGKIDLNLVAYLIAAHHGKVRLSIRSLPNETKPQLNRRFARGVWDNDKLKQTDLGDSVIAPAVTLSLEPMELGLCESPPFTGQSSWTERMLRLRDRLGPFRLAYLESILRAADMRASRKAEMGCSQ